MLDYYLDLLERKFKDKQDGASKAIHLAMLTLHLLLSTNGQSLEC
tara:strand:- start:285 stop:419 length:135 start_codon:yes stop_codon:yes gene_type:complete